MMLWFVRSTSNNLEVECSARNDSSGYPTCPSDRYISRQRRTTTTVIIGGYHNISIPPVGLYTCKHLRGARVRITNTHTNNPSDARKRVPTIPAPGGMCEPWCAAYLVVRTLLLVLTVWLGLGGELAQTAKFPLHYATSVPGGGRTYDQSLPPKVWGARIMPRSNTVEGNASMVGQDNFCHRRSNM